MRTSFSFFFFFQKKGEKGFIIDIFRKDILLWFSGEEGIMNLKSSKFIHPTKGYVHIFISIILADHHAHWHQNSFNIT